MPKRTQLHGCELHPTGDAYRVCRGAQMLGWAHRPGTRNRSTWSVSDTRGFQLPRHFPTLTGCVRYLQAQARLAAAQALATGAPSDLDRQLG